MALINASGQPSDNSANDFQGCECTPNIIGYRFARSRPRRLTSTYSVTIS
jgi:hypothetical protein